MGNDLIDEAVKKADDIEKKIKDFFDKVNDALDWVPGFLEHLIDPIIKGMEALNKKIGEFWNEVKEFFDNTGNPSKLEDYHTKWIDTVGKPLGEIAGTLDMSKLSTNTEWTGSGAEAYKAIVPPQGAGLNNMKTLATDIGNTLKTLANGIENFWISMGFALASVVVGLVGAIAGAAGVVTIPAGIAVAAGALGAAIGFISAAVIQLKTIYDNIDTSQDKIEQGIEKLGEKWSKATPQNQQKIDDTKQWEPL